MIGDNMVPIMHQDIASASMQPMPMLGLTGGMYNTHMLGGVRMQGQASEDQFEKMQEKEKKDFGFLKKVGLVIGVLAAVGFVKFAPIKKWAVSAWKSISTSCKGALDWCKNLFKSKPATPPPATP